MMRGVGVCMRHLAGAHMYRDKTLIPTEAIRMLALGILAGERMRYGELARTVRHFASRIVGPSLDILGTSLELLGYEGLVAPVPNSGHEGGTHEGGGLANDALLTITDSGRAELHTLLCSNVRAPIDDINKLVVALKMRFLHLLTPEEQREQVLGLIELSDSERTRLEDLLDHHRAGPGHLRPWLEHDIAQLDERIDWLTRFRDTL